MHSLRKYTSILLLSLLFIVGFYPVIKRLFTMWAKSDDYTFAFFALPIAIYMVWQQREKLTDWPGKGVLGFCLLLGATILHRLTLPMQVPTISFWVMLIWVVAGFVFLGGVRILWEFIVPILLFIFLVPISNQLYDMITMPLQLKVSGMSEWILNLIGVPIYREGNILQTPAKAFQVVDACSGLRSLVALNSLALVLGYFTLKKKQSILLLLVTSLPVAFMINIVRVVILVLAYHHFQVDLTEDKAHILTGLLLFSVALLLLYMIQRIIELWEAR